MLCLKGVLQKHKSLLSYRLNCRLLQTSDIYSKESDLRGVTDALLLEEADSIMTD